MQLSSNAMTILVGMLNDIAVMQRKVEAGQGAYCHVDVSEGPNGKVRVGFVATIDPEFAPRPDGQES